MKIAIATIKQAIIDMQEVDMNISTKLFRGLPRVWRFSLSYVAVIFKEPQNSQDFTTQQIKGTFVPLTPDETYHISNLSSPEIFTVASHVFFVNSKSYAF